MVQTDYSETSVINYQSTMRNISEGFNNVLSNNLSYIKYLFRNSLQL